MDVTNFISRADGLPDAPNPAGAQYVNAFQLFAAGPRVHPYLAEMTQEVVADRVGDFIMVGAMPGVTPEQAPLPPGRTVAS